MKIIVPIKQVPDTHNVQISKQTGTLQREGVPTIINPEDKNAIETALTLKRLHNAEVITITMGPPQAEEALAEAIGMGVDKGILITDKAFAGADTLATAYTLKCAIDYLGSFDLIICGRQAIDGDTAQVGPQLASALNIPQVTYVTNITIEGNKAKITKDAGEEIHVLEGNLPLLITVTKDANEPRYPSIPQMLDAYRKNKIQILTSKELNIDKTRIGLEGSPTLVKRTFSPSKKHDTEIISGTPQEIARTLFDKLHELKLI